MPSYRITAKPPQVMWGVYATRTDDTLGTPVWIGDIEQDAELNDFEVCGRVYDTAEGAAMDVARRHFANPPGRNASDITLTFG